MSQENPFYKETWFIVVVIGAIIIFGMFANDYYFENYTPEDNKPSKSISNKSASTQARKEWKRELEQIKSGPVEYKLAIINKGGPISKNDITVTRFRYLLESLEKKCINSKQDIADVLVTAQNTLKDNYGIRVELLSITEGINDYIPDWKVDADCALEAVLYIQLLK